MTETGLYLGESLDEVRERTGEQIVVEASDFTTHGVVLGMTGSGKTGLGVVLLEEALRAGIPAIILDPKGDLGNLLLTFESLTAESFEPWIDTTEASQKGIEPRKLAERTAKKWKNGLAGWGLNESHIAALRSVADLQLFTPGSTAGNPLSLLGRLDAPEADWDTAGESLREEISAWVSGLLGMVGITADPLTSREHILIAKLIEEAWRAGRSMDLATLLGQLQRPPLRKLGVFDVDTFFPEAERMKLVMRLNALVASPSFAAWLEGPPLDIDELLGRGETRGSVLSLAHLSDEERQFVVTLVLSKAVSWMRKQKGTGQLRALIYLDEAFGFAPPSANPPSKTPLLTLLKQARAHGLGVVVATQNPIDLDYKVMSNAGTWFVGRLQTQRDKARILDAMQTASGAVDTKAIDTLVGSLGKREFLWWSAKRPAPTLFTSRWAMSYLRGPLSRVEMGRLKRLPPAGAAPIDDRTSAPASSGPDLAAPPRHTQTEGASPEALAPNETRVAPRLPEGIREYFLDPGAPWAQDFGLDPRSDRFQAAVACRVHLTYRNARAGLDHVEEWECLWLDLGEGFDAEKGKEVDYDDRDLRKQGPKSPIYIVPEAPLHTKTWWRQAQGEIRSWLRRTQEVEIFANKKLKVYSRVDESKEAFEARCAEAAARGADADLAKLHEVFERKFTTARNQIETAEQQLHKAEVNVQSRKQDEVVSGVTSFFSAFFGGGSKTRKMASGISSASRRRGMTRNANARVETAKDKLDQREIRLEELELELEEKVIEVKAKWDELAAETETMEVNVARSGVEVDDIVLVWVPVS